nr:hypothetical protein [Xanthomonas bromi]
MGDDNVPAAFAAVDRALVTVGFIVDMIENGVTLPFDRDDFFVPGRAATYRTILINVIGETSILG